MSRKIFKYYLPKPQQELEVSLPENFIPLHVGLPNHQKEPNPCLWAEIDTEDPIVKHTFFTVGTGWDLEQWGDPDKAVHLGTYFQDVYVWHVYMRIDR